MAHDQEIVKRLELDDVVIEGPILEDEGMRAFEYWGGEHHPLEELLEYALAEIPRQAKAVLEAFLRILIAQYAKTYSDDKRSSVRTVARQLKTLAEAAVRQ
jgi:hypothetical protein